MPIFENAFALQVPVQIEHLRISFFVNQNLYVVSSECNSVPHNHHDYELRYVASGVGNQIISGKRFALPERSCIITKPFEYHWQAWSPNTPSSSQYNLRFSLRQPSKQNAAEVEVYESFVRFLDNLRLLHDEDGRMLSLFRALSEEIYNKENGFIHMVRSLCAQIMVNLIRLSGEDPGIFSCEELKYADHERRSLDHFFLAKYLTNVRIHDLAKEMNVSVRQVNYILNKMYGMSFVQKLTEMRLQQAMLQLAQTDKQISEISHNCGFQNQNYFAKCFQKYYSMTPTQYRKMLRRMH